MKGNVLQRAKKRIKPIDKIKIGQYDIERSNIGKSHEEFDATISQTKSASQLSLVTPQKDITRPNAK